MGIYLQTAVKSAKDYKEVFYLTRKRREKAFGSIQTMQSREVRGDTLAKRQIVMVS